MRFFSALLPILLAATSVHAQPNEPANLLNNGDFARGEDGWQLPGENAATSFVDVTAGPFKRALRVVLNPKPGDEPWSIMMRQPIDASIKKGDPLVLRLWLRSPESIRVGVFVEENKQPYAKLLGQTLDLTPEWKEYELRGEAKADYKREDTHLVFHLGHAPGTLEMAGIRLFNPNAPPDVGRSTATPEKPESLIENGDFRQPLAAGWNWTKDAIQTEIVPADVTGYPQALRLTVTPPPNANPWEVQIGQKVKRVVSRDDAVYFRAWMRSPDGLRVGIIYEMVEAPNDKYISQTPKLTPEWKEYRFVGYPKRSFGPGESQFKFFLGYDKGVVEVAGVRLENYGKAPKSMFSETIDYWGGVAHLDTWRAPALERIEKIRKGDLKVRVLDANGQPVPGAQVKIEQQRHHFRWGTAGPVSRLLDTTNPNNLRYQQEVKRLFNTFVFESDLKWPNSLQPGRLEQIEQGIAWLNANGIEHVRGHNLVWGSGKYLPAGMLDLPQEQLTKAIHDHIVDLAGRMRGKVYVWDVVNEAATNVELWDKIGWENFANAYKWTREVDPNVGLAYNDYNITNESRGSAQRTKVKERIQYLLDHGAPLDIIGDQAHMSPPLTPIHRVLEILDEVAQFGKRIEITEFDVTVLDDQVHGDYTRDYMIAAFIHPQVDAFLMWGFWEGSHWLADKGGAM
ncbi:MAG: endo-1,4-beta-xylanase, partial [Armatimonadota bacterium]|nr:endo-1,4-beta-xylanase [Armatimonadota bacterium]